MNENIGEPRHLIVFTLDERQYALDLGAVERIVRAVDVTPLPRAPDVVLGVINVQGRICPVINIRRRFSLPERELDLSDHLVIAHTSRGGIVLVVDTVIGVIAHSQENLRPADEIVPGLEYIEGILKLDDGEIVIVIRHDVEALLSFDEQAMVAEAVDTL